MSFRAGFVAPWPSVAEPMDSRYVTALVGLLLSVVVSVAAWVLFDTLLLFLLIPFIPWLVWRRSGGVSTPPVRHCSTCGFSTRQPDFAYCPRDGSRLERQ